MAFKILLILVWSVCCVVMNLGAKKIALCVVSDQGIGRLVASVLQCCWFYIFVAGAVGTTIIYMWMLRLMPLSIAGSIVSALAVVLIVITGVLFYKEDILHARQIIGIILTLAGIVLIQSG